MRSATYKLQYTESSLWLHTQHHASVSSTSKYGCARTVIVAKKATITVIAHPYLLVELTLACCCVCSHKLDSVYCNMYVADVI